MNKSRLILFIILFIILTACQNQSSAEALNGTAWSLSQLNGHSLVDGSHIEVQFELGRLSGFGGCNSYGATYQLRGDQFSVTEGIESTAMACLTPEGVGEQESEYFLALREAASYLINGNRLELRDAGGKLLLVFIHQQAEPALEMESLIGSQWQVSTVEGQYLLPGSQITMHFVKPGIVEGFGGCRNYYAEYIETDEGVRFSSMRMGEEDCRQADLLIQEQDFTDYFTWAEHFELVGDNLILFTQRGEEIVFVPFEE